MACLLSESIRKRIWEGLQEGRDPDSLKRIAADATPVASRAASDAQPASNSNSEPAANAGPASDSAPETVSPEADK